MGSNSFRLHRLLFLMAGEFQEKMALPSTLISLQGLCRGHLPYHWACLLQTQ